MKRFATASDEKEANLIMKRGISSGDDGGPSPTGSPAGSGNNLVGNTRTVHVNQPDKTRRQHFAVIDNRISNTKYTVWTFLPKNLLEQFSLHINRYFLIIAILQMFPTITPVNPLTTWLPLLVIFSISATKEARDDLRRAREDKRANTRQVTRFDAMTTERREVSSQDVIIGDLVFIEEGEQLPSDLVLLVSSSTKGDAYLQTTNLDGETNLKPRIALRQTQALTLSGIGKFTGVVSCPLPDKHIYKFDAALFMEPSPGDSLSAPSSSISPALALSADQLLQQGCTLRDTEWVVGAAVYTGNETKFGKNKTTPPSKMTQNDLLVNKISVGIFVLQLVAAIALGLLGVHTANASTNDAHTGGDHWYLRHDSNSEGLGKLESLIYPLRFILLNSTMIPISLKVCLDLCKICYSYFICVDKYMFPDSLSSFPASSSASVGGAVVSVAQQHNSGKHIYSQTGGGGGNHSHSNSREISADIDLDRTPLLESSPLPVRSQDREIARERRLSLHTQRSSVGESNDLTHVVVDDEDSINNKRRSKRSSTHAEPLPLGVGAVANNTSISEDLGQIQFVLSDKTGTLTQNKMVFAACAIDVNSYRVDDCRKGGPVCSSIRKGDPTNTEFFRALALNSSVTPNNHPNHPEADDWGVVYKGCSPDEISLVSAASKAGVRLVSRSVGERGTEITLEVAGQPEDYIILAELSFTSDRKRMSVVVLNKKTNEIRLYMKGADDVVGSLVRKSDLSQRKSSASASSSSLSSSPSASTFARIQANVDNYARLGLRTLLLAERDLTKEEFNEWFVELGMAQTTIEGREQALAAVYDKLEKDVRVIGATAIEDRLQDKVPDTIQALRDAGMKVWMLTGDKYLTALQVATACKLTSADWAVEKIDGSSTAEVLQSIRTIAPRLSIAPAETAVVITGETLKWALVDHAIESHTRDLKKASSDGNEREIKRLRGEIHRFGSLKKEFAELCVQAATIIACRVSPSQKAEMVRVVRGGGGVTLAVGDGGNDVAMIQAAQIGVGIRGKEGLQAARAADYQINTFCHLQRLLLIHGQFSYLRSSLVVLYSFYKSMFFCLLQIVYATHSQFSGVSLFNGLCIAAYNAVLFFPVVTLVLDKRYPFSSALKHPKLYQSCAKGEHFNFTALFFWLARAIVQAMVVWWLCVLTRDESYISPRGFPPDYDTFGTIVFLLFIWIQSVTLMLELRYITVIHVVVIWAFHILSYFLLIVTSLIRPLNDLTGYGSIAMLLSEPAVWLTHILGTAITALPIVTYRFYRSWNPTLEEEIRFRAVNHLTTTLDSCEFREVSPSMSRSVHRLKERVDQYDVDS